jgi:CPA2 family monovalent cation:H+ antiporter-2
MPPELVHVVSVLAVVVGAGALSALLFQVLRLPVVLGYIVTGLVIGPHVTRLVVETSLIETLSQLGVVFLFFTIGLEFSVRTIARVGLLTLVTVLLELGFIVAIMLGLGRAFGWTPVESLFVAFGVAIASTMLVVKGLDEERVDAPAKQLILAMMVVEDLLSILLLAILTGVASGAGLSAGALLHTSARLAGFLVGMVAVGVLVVPRVVRHVARFERADTLVVTSLAICAGFVWLALRAGYPVALGAFVAGTVIAESGKGAEVDHLVRPFRDVFAAIFFVSIGTTIVPAEIRSQWLTSVVVAVVLVVVKTSGVTVAAFLTGNGLRRSIQAGLALSQIGELSFIAVGIGIAAGPAVARPLLLPVVVGASCITAMTGTQQIKSGARIAAWLVERLPTPARRFVAFYEARVKRPAGPGPAASLSEVSSLLTGLQAIPVVLADGSPAVGKSLADLDLRAKTGASVLAITRSGGATAPPAPREPLCPGDVLALTGSEESLARARALLLGDLSSRGGGAS